ncbi:hypothetical protein BDV32DRAFT_148965 [Aspergillus pseudonomiae]|uniref:Uncharacterized protein n=1 Tax=Aspergillus pseudonomiae TaxID=1506151 RepID=A0A5N6I3X3_9EURO|nr:uncharacterized protein BDV37DRAFT_283750 [Aspergillus pseudonomiae]KAB8261098.1 hypothetical protein BDV32DRAFT_148965 [Aspergillus pseudonomiae]KAE8403513.1 hypothetical protein BDV37DRAFT_283750 [Aspergillus pseudonomiae]
MPRKRQRSDEDEESQAPSRKGLRLTRSRVCMQCKKQKTKCETKPGETSCNRCIRYELECISHDISQQFLQEDSAWKTQTTADIALLRAAVNHLLQQTKQPELWTFSNSQVVGSPRPRMDSQNVSQTSMAAMDMSRENSPQLQEENSSGLVTVPMRNLYELTRLKNLRVNAGWKPKSSLIHDDFISQGMVTLAEAEYLFDRFMRINNRLLWDGILPYHRTLDSVRRASTLLAAVVLTIGALHTPGKTESFHQSYDVFVSLVCSSSLSRNHSVDDVRALCIGAFYLANLSWKLSGQATRIAAEIGLHQSYQKLIQGDGTQRDRVCLWYATYVCDHQFSIAHGRPPAAVDDESIRNIERFMHTAEVNPGDARLAAQVALFAILTEAYVAFGNEPDRLLEDKDFDKLWVSNVAIDQWRLQWQPRSKDCATLGSYPSKALVLYYHFARFQLNSLALRGISPSGLTSNPELTSKSPLSLAHREAANAAIAAAISTLTLILEDDDLRRAFPGVPIFTYTMVAFCATFLLKMAATWGKSSTQFGLAVNTSHIVSLVQRSADMLANVAMSLNERHLAKHIATGMLEMLQQFRALDESDVTELSNRIEGDDIDNFPALPSESNDGNAFWAGDYNFYDLGGTFGFGLDETLLGQMAADNFELGI